MDQQIDDRRVEARFTPPAAARATLRPGCVVVIVDVSGGGALVEGPRPMRPGSRVHLQVATAARTYSIDAQVMRCTVWIVDPIDGVRYRGALRFDRQVEWTWGGGSRSGHNVPETGGPASAQFGHALPAPGGSGDEVRRKAAK